MDACQPRLLPAEVIPHNVCGDVWVTVLGRVLDVSDVADPAGTLGSRLLFSFAGKDLSHYFDPDTQDVSASVLDDIQGLLTEGRCAVCQVATYVHPWSGAEVPLLAADDGRAWWREASRLRGLLTARARPIRILDTFSGTQALLTVCSEDSTARVLERYAAFNGGVRSCRYSCVAEDADGVVVGLDPSRTLEENGVADERDLYVALGLPEDLYVPVLQLIRGDAEDDDPSPRAETGPLENAGQ